jgi:hypothetical protein
MPLVLGVTTRLVCVCDMMMIELPAGNLYEELMTNL